MSESSLARQIQICEGQLERFRLQGRPANDRIVTAWRQVLVDLHVLQAAARAEHAAAAPEQAQEPDPA